MGKTLSIYGTRKISKRINTLQYDTVNVYSDKDSKEIFLKNIERFEHIKKLYIAHDIPANVIDKLKNVETLVIELRGRVYLKEIFKLSSLKEIIIWFCDDVTTLEFPKEIKNLKSLIFKYSRITELPEEIFNNTSLEVLNIHGTKITKLSKSIGNLKNLRSLDLSETDITEFPIEICDLKNLNYLNLADTEITKLPEKISNLENLMRLNISDTNVDNTCIEELNNLDYLQWIYLHGCKNIDFEKMPKRINGLYKQGGVNWLYYAIDRISIASLLSEINLYVEKDKRMKEIDGKLLNDLIVEILNMDINIGIVTNEIRRWHKHYSNIDEYSGIYLMRNKNCYTKKPIDETRKTETFSAISRLYKIGPMKIQKIIYRYDLVIFDILKNYFKTGSLSEAIQIVQNREVKKES